MTCSTIPLWIDSVAAEKWAHNYFTVVVSKLTKCLNLMREKIASTCHLKYGRYNERNRCKTIITERKPWPFACESQCQCQVNHPIQATHMARFTPSCAFLSSSAVASSCSSFSSALAISDSTAPRAPRLILAASSGAEMDCSPNDIRKYSTGLNPLTGMEISLEVGLGLVSG